MAKLLFNLWVWEGRSWVISSSHRTSKEAHQVGRNPANLLDTWTVVKLGTLQEEHMRSHCTERDAPYL